MPMLDMPIEELKKYRGTNIMVMNTCRDILTEPFNL